MKPLGRARDDERGFTLIEVIAVLIIIGVLVAIGLSRLLITSPDVTAQADIVKSHLRFAQLKALHDDTATWGIAFASSSYTLRTGAAAASIILPGESSGTHSLPAGVTITNPSTVTFDAWGSPGMASIPITLSQGGESKTITVAANTGYIAP